MVEKATRQIVTCITRVQGKPDLTNTFEHPEKYELMTDPPYEMLKNYQFFWERP